MFLLISFIALTLLYICTLLVRIMVQLMCLHDHYHEDNPIPKITPTYLTGKDKSDSEVIYNPDGDGHE